MLWIENKKTGMTPRFFIFKVKIFVTGLADIIGGGCNVEYEDGEMQLQCYEPNF